MINTLRNISVIASNERRMLYRQARFWVLTLIGLVGILFFMVVMTIITIVEDNIPGEFLLEGTDAYLGLYFFSYLQAILIIFIAGDFRKSEEKSQLDQVMLSRPMTTANWVIGKYVGVVSAVLLVNVFLIVVATIGRILKVIFTGTGFNVLPFLKYFVIASLPSILFMSAFMFFLVSLFRAQAVAVIASLGYVASILFYFHHDFLGLFDYGAFFAPIFSSDFIGFGDITAVLWQRLFFVLVAFALVGSCVLLYPRLWQSRLSRYMSMAFTGLFLLAAGATAFRIVDKHYSGIAQRKQDIQYQKQWHTEQLCRISNYDLDIKLVKSSKPLEVVARLSIENPNSTDLATLLFSLNRSLRILEVTWSDGAEIPFQHRHHVLSLDISARPLQASAPDTIQLRYSGTIDADGFMLDRLPESLGLINKRTGPWIQPDMSAWLSSDFAVLPAQCGWYPIPGVAAGYDYKSPRPKTFATANISVDVAEDLTVIAQGDSVSQNTTNDRSVYSYSVNDPVPGFSLNIGRYDKLARRFRDLDMELYFHPKHLLEYDMFAEVADTCYEAVDQILQSMESIAGVKYPYTRFAIVEVPLHMQVFTDRFGVNNILQQPGIVMIPEVSIARMRFKREIEDDQKRQKRRGRDDSPKKIKRDAFVDYVLDAFFPDSPWRGDGSLRSIMKNYINFQVDIQDPLLERALELQMHETAERKIRDLFYPDRRNESLSSYDRMRRNEHDWYLSHRYNTVVDSVLAVVTETPLSELRPYHDGGVYRAAIDFKAPQVLEIMSKSIGEKQYLAALEYLLDNRRYQAVNEDTFLSAIETASGENMDDFYAQWMHESTYPGYRILSADAEKLDTGDMKIIYQITSRILNGEKGDGFVRIMCNTRKDKVYRNIELASYEEKEVRFPVTDEPRTVQVIPYFSRNRGQIMKQITISNRIVKGTPVDTSYAVSSATDSLFFVIDDQDDGFFTPVSAESKYLRPPSKGSAWRERTASFAFGKYYFGWRTKRAGDGDYPARWETSVPYDGDYELSYYFRVGRSWIRRRHSRTFKVAITDASGRHEIDFQPQETPDGWYPLGRYSFTKKKPAVIELLDEGRGYLIADAVRWEFVE